MKNNYRFIPFIIVVVILVVFSISFSASSSVMPPAESTKPLNTLVGTNHGDIDPGRTNKQNPVLNAFYNPGEADEKENPAGSVQPGSYGFDYDSGFVEEVKSSPVVKHNPSEKNSSNPDNNFVGDETGIEQKAATSQGTVKRHADISSPWSGAYVYEDMKVVGKAEITDSFRMNNLKPGVEADKDWFDQF